jgi:hypothetical protein
MQKAGLPRTGWFLMKGSSRNIVKRLEKLFEIQGNQVFIWQARS